MGPMENAKMSLSGNILGCGLTSKQVSQVNAQNFGNKF